MGYIPCEEVILIFPPELKLGDMYLMLAIQ